jgi:hypothetical protein
MTGPTKPSFGLEPARRVTLRWAVSHEAWALEHDVAGARVDGGSIAHALAVFAAAHGGHEVDDREVLTKSAEALRAKVERAEVEREIGAGATVRFEWHEIQSSIGYVTAHGERAARPVAVTGRPATWVNPPYSGEGE